MKPILLLPLVAVPMLFNACAPVVVERPYRRTAYVEHDDYYYRHHPRRDVVVVEDRPVVNIRYYNDRRGRYYMKDGRRIYVRAIVY